MASREMISLDALPLNEAVAVGDERGVIVRTANGVTGFVNRCPHQDRPLTGAHVADGVLICPHHFWRFELPDGQLRSQQPQPTEQPQQHCLTALKVTIEGNEVAVELPVVETPAMPLRDQLLARAQSWNRDDPPDPHHPGAQNRKGMTS